MTSSRSDSTSRNGHVRPSNEGGTPTREEEAGLVERLKSGDEAAFEEMVRGYGPRMLAVARRFLSREADAEDALQDAFLNAFRAIQKFAGDSRLSTWLHRVTVNAALMRIRTRSRRPESSVEDLHEEAMSDASRGGWELTAPEALAREEVRRHVQTALGRLPEEIRAVLRLHDIEGLDLRETASLLGIGLTTVKTRLYWGRHALRGLLDASLGAPTP
jgi:RNA polymerase sigma-70 factor (ECF subfamily)